MQRYVSTVSLLIASASAGSLPIATFDGAKATTWEWHTVNDPVMGGQSKSQFTVDSDRHLGVWAGQVKIVPFLGAPGFCNLQSPGLGKTADFPDISAYDGITVRAREATDSGLVHFNVQLMSKGAKRFFKKGVYSANITLTASLSDHFVPWSAFECTWRGEKVDWCPELSKQLDQINSVGLGSAFPGIAGPFNLEIDSLSASTSTALQDQAYIELATFAGHAQHKWHSENDPVMGGRSSSTVEVMASYADYKGTTRIVPALGAPGFTIAMTEGFPLLSKFPDVASMDGLTISVRQVASNFSGYKIAFCDSHINFYRCQMQSFKADLRVPQSADNEFQDVFVPWSMFSDRWNAATGKHTAEHPPSASSLNSITQLQVWTEAVEGDFHLQFQYIRATKAPAFAAPAVAIV